ncbi:MAG: hypothetical protein WBA89_22415 [Microcoleus sp.]|uniref:hypothetical protein n=1 Tax=Microcoleus sp. TaxID=44472 RepID=UPI003C78A277
MLHGFARLADYRMGNWELGIGNWELGIGNWELGSCRAFLKPFLKPCGLTSPRLPISQSPRLPVFPSPHLLHGDGVTLLLCKS